MTDASAAPAATPTPDPKSGESESKGFMTELSASLVVFLVAVPLCLGIALASNAPVMAGLIAGIIGGIIIGPIAGAPLQVSGPAAGLVVLVFGLTEQMNGDWRMVCAVIVISGLMQVAFAVLRIAKFSLAVSPAVVHGMLAGIGVLIALGQLHVILGGKPQSKALDNIMDLPGQLATPNLTSIGIGLLALAILVFWPKIKHDKLKKLPAPLIAVVVATLAALPIKSSEPPAKVMSIKAAKLLAKQEAEAAGKDPEKAMKLAAAEAIKAKSDAQQAAIAKAAKDNRIERISFTADDHSHVVKDGQIVADDEETKKSGDQGHLLAAIGLPRWPDHLPLTAILLSAFTLAMIASVESLLCAVATDKLHGGEPANLDRELFAQGVGNTVSGMVGGLPITGVIVRSSANINAGAQTRWSAVMHGFWILIFIGALPFLVEAIPKTVLAALLVLIGFRLVNLKEAKHLHEHGELAIYVITVLGVVFINLLAGVAIGFGVAMARLIYNLSKVQIEPTGANKEGREVVKITGALTFLGVPKLTDQLRKIERGKKVEIDLAVESLDHAGWTALNNWKDVYEAGGGDVLIEQAEHLWTAEDHAKAPAAPAEGAAAAKADAAADAEPVKADAADAEPVKAAAEGEGDDKPAE